MVTIVVYTCTGQVGFSGSPIPMHRQTYRQLVYYLGVGSAGFGQSVIREGFPLAAFGFFGGGKFNLVVV